MQRLASLAKVVVKTHNSTKYDSIITVVVDATCILHLRACCHVYEVKSVAWRAPFDQFSDKRRCRRVHLSGGWKIWKAHPSCDHRSAPQPKKTVFEKKVGFTSSEELLQLSIREMIVCIEYLWAWWESYDLDLDLDLDLKNWNSSDQFGSEQNVYHDNSVSLLRNKCHLWGIHCKKKKKKEEAKP